MLSIEFHYRRSRRGDDYLGSVFVRVIASRKSATFTLPYRLYPSEWDVAGRKIVISGEPSRRDYLMYSAACLDKDRELLNRLRKETPVGSVHPAGDLLTVFRMRRLGGPLFPMVEHLSGELLVAGRERTARAYRSAWSAWKLFLSENPDYPERIYRDAVQGFEVYLREKGRSLNTISFYMRNLRAMYNKAVRRGWLLPELLSPFDGVYTGVAPSEKRALSAYEMKKLENLLDSSFLSEKEKHALGLFLFSFHGRGISFVDLAYLKKSDCVSDVLRYRRKKTGAALEVKLTDPMKRLLKRFGHSTADSPYLFGLIDPANPSGYQSYTHALRLQNSRLWRIGRKAGLSRSLSTHMSRHSWATIAKRAGITIWLISEGLGHRDLKTTYIYLDSFDAGKIHRAARKVSASVSSAV